MLSWYFSASFEVCTLIFFPGYVFSWLVLVNSFLFAGHCQVCKKRQKEDKNEFVTKSGGEL